MTELEKVQAQIKELQVKEEELKKAELKPYDWSDQEVNYIHSDGRIPYDECSMGDDLFTFAHLKQAESFAKKLRLQSVILRLKQSLGDEWEFNSKQLNQFVYYCSKDKKFYIESYYYVNSSLIHFNPETGNAQKVADWLNKNWDYETGEVEK